MKNIVENECRIANWEMFKAVLQMQMGRGKVLFLFVLLLFMTGCGTFYKYPIWFYKGLPEQILYIENDIKRNLEQASGQTINGYFIRPITTKKNDIGIYSYSSAVLCHNIWYHAFMYNGDTVLFTNMEDSIGMSKFLQENNFSKSKIKEWNKTFQQLKKDAEMRKEFKL